MLARVLPNTLFVVAALLTAALACGVALAGTPTENLGIRALPVPGAGAGAKAVVIDGKFDDWDLSGGMFICNNVEKDREQFSAWVHLMYDAEHLYLLARVTDRHPMANGGIVGSDNGFGNDCWQFRFITNYKQPNERVAHFTAWQGRGGAQAIDITYGRTFKDGQIKDAQTHGAEMALLKGDDGKSYTQEIKLPLSLIATDTAALLPGVAAVMTFEMFFAPGSSSKDNFRPGVDPDRIFTFRAYDNWGTVTFVSQRNVAPAAVRLADSREFPVAMQGNVPVIDWAGLVKDPFEHGFKPIEFEMPFDGLVSLHIRDAEGKVVRQFLSAAEHYAGKHTYRWDGLTTPLHATPGEPLPPGRYTWHAIAHPGLDLVLRGWASNAGAAPWDAKRTDNWGGDHGIPWDVVAAKDRVILGWTGAEAGKPAVCVDLDGNVKWRHIRGGMGGAGKLAVDGEAAAGVPGVVYVLDGTVVYRLDLQKGDPTFWAGKSTADLPLASVWPGPEPMPKDIAAIEARGGLLYVAFGGEGPLPGAPILVIDGSTGELRKTIPLTAAGRMRFGPDGRLYAISGGDTVVAIDVESGKSTTVVRGVQSACALAVDGEGLIYVGTREPDHQVKVYDATGQAVRSIGKAGGRAEVGPWDGTGIRSLGAVGVDAQGRVWIAEGGNSPKRFAVFDGRSGQLQREFFGPTHYGASGGTILPGDPYVMVGEGCEWRIDPATGRDVCTGVVENRIASFARFSRGKGGRVYLTTAGDRGKQFNIHERLGDGDYRLRATIHAGDRKTTARVWSDTNDDQQEQEGEVLQLPYALGLGGYIGWSAGVADDLSLWAGVIAPQPPVWDRKTQTKEAYEAIKQKWQDELGPLPPAAMVPLQGVTACGAPVWDFKNLRPLPQVGNAPLPTTDHAMVAAITGDDKSGMWFSGIDMRTGQTRWTYPNQWHGVHGSHRAPPPAPGLVRGAFGFVGCVKGSSATGHVWAVNSNVGEWYLLTQSGFFLSSLFEGDLLEVQWPPQAAPGTKVNAIPAGAGAEDFGGSMVQGGDGRVFIQAGKTALWNIELVGLDKVVELAGGSLQLTDADAAKAAEVRQSLMQQSKGRQLVVVRRGALTFTGDLAKDFAAAQPLDFARKPNARVRARLAYDDEALYVGWEVSDDSPWVNGADAPQYLYARGDTVDLQLTADPKADARRATAALGDLRLSIGPFKGKPTAVIYREKAADKAPMTFSSGVVKTFEVESVRVADEVEVKVVTKRGAYTVEARVPLTTLGLASLQGLTLDGDLGATHGDESGSDTILRSYWNNQQTGLVSDEVYELRLEPANWGRLQFE